MPKKALVGRGERVPSVPAPASESARDGMTEARELARRSLPNAVRTLAAIAFSPESDAGLHTRQQTIKQISDIAGVIPQALPSVPTPLVEERGVNGGEAD